MRRRLLVGGCTAHLQGALHVAAVVGACRGGGQAVAGGEQEDLLHRQVRVQHIVLRHESHHLHPPPHRRCVSWCASGDALAPSMEDGAQACTKGVDRGRREVARPLVAIQSIQAVVHIHAARDGAVVYFARQRTQQRRLACIGPPATDSGSFLYSQVF